MQDAAVQKARLRLIRVTGAVARLSTANNFEEFHAAWTDYLWAAAGVFTTLEQGAKGHQPSYHWFSQIKGQRRSDPLLCYLHHARNAEEHGLHPVAKHNPGHIGIGKGGEPVHIESITFDRLGRPNVKLKPVNGKLPTVEFVMPYPELLPVIDSGVVFPVPSSHLGQAIPEATPTAVAVLGSAYCAMIVDQSDGLERH